MRLPPIRPPDHVALVVVSSSVQPGGGATRSSATPGGASTESETVKCGGRSFGVWNVMVDLVFASTYEGAIVTCASAVPGSTTATAAARNASGKRLVRGE